jgi:transposase
MSRFPTPQALVSWAGLTPAARQSGPRKGRGKKGHGNTYAKRIAVLAAYAAANTGTFRGYFLIRPPSLIRDTSR